MTSVPAPLKFLAPHYAPLEATHAALPAGHPAAAPLSDVLSALAMTSAPGGSRACLRYKLTGAAGADVAVWGHEYVRHLSGEIGEEVGARRAAGEAVDDLLALVDLIVPYDMSHNAGAQGEGACVGVAAFLWRGVLAATAPRLVLGSQMPQPSLPCSAQMATAALRSPSLPMRPFQAPSYRAVVNLSPQPPLSHRAGRH